MNTIKNIARNSGVIIAGQAVEMFFNLVLLGLLARYFGQSDFGKLSFLSVFFFFIGSNDNLLIRPILVREMARDPARAPVIIGNGMIIRALFSLFAVALLWLCIWFIKCPVEIIQLAIFTSLGLLMSSLSGSYEIIFQVHLNVWYVKVINFISLLGTIITLYAVIFFKGSLLQYNILILIPGLVSLWLIKHYADRFIRADFQLDLQIWKKIFHDSWPLLLTAVFIFIYHRIDQVILLGVQGPAGLGSYSVAVKLAEMFTIIAIALKVSVLPVMSAYFKSSPDNFNRTYRLGFKYLLLFIIPVAFWVSLFSGEIISFIYGKEFLSSGPVLSILIWAEIFVFVGIMNNTILVAADQQILDPVFTGISALVNIILNLILIPRYGFMGAAISSLLTYPVGPIMGYFIKSTRPYSSCMLYYSLKPFSASLFMFLFIYYTRHTFWLSFIVSPFIYLLAIFFIRGIDKDDIRIARAIISTG